MSTNTCAVGLDAWKKDLKIKNYYELRREHNIETSGNTGAVNLSASYEFLIASHMSSWEYQVWFLVASYMSSWKYQVWVPGSIRCDSWWHHVWVPGSIRCEFLVVSGVIPGGIIYEFLEVYTVSGMSSWEAESIRRHKQLLSTIFKNTHTHKPS